MGKWQLLVLTAIYLIFALIFGGLNAYYLDRDIDSLIDRAQVAGNAEDMLGYMTQLKHNMESYGMTSGYTALVFKTPRNDMSLHYKTVTRVIERLEKIKGLSENETTYQVALNDLRGVIRELPNPADGWFYVKYFWWLLLIGTVLIGLTFWAFYADPY